MNMKRAIVSSTLIVGMILISTYAFAQSEADLLYQQAQEFEKKTYYDKAYETYEKARERHLEIGDLEKAKACRIQMQQIEKIFLDYYYTKEDAIKLLEENFKYISKSERNSWIEKGKIDFIMSDGQPFYSTHFITNLKYRNLELMKKDLKLIESEREFFAKYQDLVFRYPGSSYPPRIWRPYINPVTFLASASLPIPRGELPEVGLLKIWIPLPVQTGAQDNIRVISVMPEEYVKIPPRVDGDIGHAYLEIPLEQLKEDLNIRLQFIFSHYEQRFIIDPENAGEYDKESDLYKKYTRSYGNTTITPEIREKAQQIVEDEKNPYLATKRIYDYIVENIDYSLMPHFKLNVLGQPESIYVHENLHGDCAAQGIYFSTLCRSLGIPARTTGGMQLCPGKESMHFWAEFYLPNYGWIPVDTSIAQSANIPPELTDNQRKAFKEFFFGSQDPYRYAIQKDVDMPLTPRPDEPILLPMAIQFPAVVCETSKENPNFLALKYWKIEFEPVYR
ncbi:MAG: transglutaminase domain-containing protein [Candidatus Aerophobus sp.]|nr:MAG: transglutaminase domain-containing protein [Candidatus Aerophobus sp.]